MIGAAATVLLVATTGLLLNKPCWHGTEPWTCTLIMQGPGGTQCRLPRVEVCATATNMARLFATKKLEPLPPRYAPVDMLCNQQRFQTDTTYPMCNLAPANAGEGSP